MMTPFKCLAVCFCLWSFFLGPFVEGQDYFQTPEDRARDYLLDRCQNLTQGCPAEKGLADLTIVDVFSMMATSGARQIEPLCADEASITSCLGGCLNQFRTSKYGHLFNMCGFLRQIGWERRCWDSRFLEEARRCFSYHYLPRRMRNFYPTPFRVYDRRTIARDCFHDDEDDAHCLFHKSMIMLRLMPSYYELHPYPEPEVFNHVDDLIGFTGYTGDSDNGEEEEEEEE